MDNIFEVKVADQISDELIKRIFERLELKP